MCRDSNPILTYPIPIKIEKTEISAQPHRRDNVAGNDAVIAASRPSYMHNPRQSRINSVSRTVLISPTNRDWDLQAITRRIGQSDWRSASVNAEGPVTHTQPPMFNHPFPRSTPSRAIVRRVQNQANTNEGWPAFMNCPEISRSNRIWKSISSLSLPHPHSVWEIEDSTRINYATNCRDHETKRGESDYCSIVYD